MEVSQNESIKKRAKKFAKEIYSLYGERGYTLDRLFQKAYKKKKEKNISNEVFD